MDTLLFEFEWDEKKNLINTRKHGVDFNIACKVFADPSRLERIDRSEGNKLNEERFQTIGFADIDRILMVVYTIRNDRYRLISARLAKSEERRAYYGYGKKDSDNGCWGRADSFS